MTIGLFLVMLYRLQECLSLVHYLSILYGYHLVEVDSLPLVCALVGLLVCKPDRPRPKRLQMVPGAQLIVQHFELVLNLRIIATWSWHVVSWDGILPWNGVGERVLHRNLRKRHTSTNRLQNHCLLLFCLWIALILIRRWTLLVCGVSKWHNGNITPN